MAGPSGIRRYGNVCRFYKNINDILMACDCITVSIDCRQIKKDQFFLHVDKVNIDRKIFHLEGAGGIRTIYKVLTFGDYTSITEDSGNFLEVSWAAKEPEYNDIVFSLESYPISKIGDTI